MPTLRSRTRLRALIERVRAIVNHPATDEHLRAVAQFKLDRLQGEFADAAADAIRNRTWYGAKYGHTGTLSTVDIAALIRAEIKLARKLATTAAGETALALSDPIGDAPAGIKFSVRVPYYGAIRIAVAGVPRDWGWEQVPDEWGNPQWKYTPALNRLLDQLRTVLDAYNHDGSDLITDYIDKRFSGSVITDWRDDPRDQEGIRP